MRWEDERYVRVYTRDTPDWLGLGWEAQALFLLLLRKVDRVGTVDLGRHGPRSLAAFLAMPFDVVTRSLNVLLEDGCIEMNGTTLLVKNFIEAQEASMSPNQRQTESRLRRRDMIRSGLDPSQRSTCLYFIQSEDGGPIKIGCSDDVAKRLVGLQTARADKLVLLGAIPCTVADERAAHAAFQNIREKGEWFTPAPQLMAFITACVTSGKVRLDLVTSHELSDVTSRDASQNDRGHSEPIRSVPSLAEPNQPNHPVSVSPDPRAPASQVPIQSTHTQSAESYEIPALPDAEWLATEFRRFPAIERFASDDNLCVDLAAGIQDAGYTYERAKRVVAEFVTKVGGDAREMDRSAFQARFGGFVTSARGRASNRQPTSEPQFPEVREALTIFAERWKASRGAIRIEETDDAEHAASCIEMAKKAIVAAKSDARPREVYRRAVDAYLADSASWLADAQWPLRMLAKKFSSYATLPASKTRPAPAKAAEEPTVPTRRRATYAEAAAMNVGTKSGNMGPALALVFDRDKASSG